jgi:hypothetical protein
MNNTDRLIDHPPVQVCKTRQCTVSNFGYTSRYVMLRGVVIYTRPVSSTRTQTQDRRIVNTQAQHIEVYKRCHCCDERCVIELWRRSAIITHCCVTVNTMYVQYAVNCTVYLKAC